MESKVNSVIYFDTVEVVHKSSVPWVWARRVSEIGIGDWIYGFISDGVRGMCRVGGAGVEEFAVGAVPRGAATVAGPRLQRPEQAQAQGTHQDGGLASFLLHGAADRRVRCVYSPPLCNN